MRGVVRLISSARTTLAKIGPLRKSKVCSWAFHIDTPTMRSLYEQRGSVYALARVFGVSRMTVAKELTRRGIEWDSTHPSIKNRSFVHAMSDDELLEAIRDGVANAADTLIVSKDTIYRELRKRGIKTNGNNR